MAARQTSIQKRVRAVILLASVIVLFVTATASVVNEAISFRARLVRNVCTLAGGGVIADNSAAPLAFDFAYFAFSAVNFRRRIPLLCIASIKKITRRGDAEGAE
jgi:uncharacterized protein (DUF3084 family)